jgi:hypothetical protein
MIISLSHVIKQTNDLTFVKSILRDESRLQIMQISKSKRESNSQDWGFGKEKKNHQIFSRIPRIFFSILFFFFGFYLFLSFEK